VREAVCAFSNDLAHHNEPGIIVLGVTDDGQLTDSFSATDELLRQLADIKTDGNILPQPVLFVEKRSFETREILVVTVSPSDSPPVRYKGRIHVRWGPRRGLASAHDERILNERRRHGDRPFDLHAVRGAGVEDIDQVRFESEYLPSLVAPDVLRANERTYLQRLAATKVLASEESCIPTVVGLLVCGREVSSWIPGAYTQFLRFSGPELISEIIDEVAIYGTVSDQLRQLEEKLDSHNRRAVDITGSTQERVDEQYAIGGLRQLVRNAYLHRSYESTNAPVRVYWFSDRVEIHSPGGPYGVVTTSNFGSPGLTDYRNPNLSEALHSLGYIQRFGVGLAIARSNFGSRLSFQVSDSAVSATVWSEGRD
jgi:ATP-dependent DNA helicase RecG